MQPLRYRGRATSPPAPASTLRTLAAALTALVAVATGGPAAAAPGESGGTAAVPRTQALAILLRSQTAMSAPDERSAVLQRMNVWRPITGEPTALPVIGHRAGRGGVAWLRVRLPGRPNGRTGWIRQRATIASTTVWHIVVDISKRRVTVYRRGRAVRVFRAVVGKSSTPTPLGEFFVEEAVRLRGTDVGAPFALALSARSDVLQEFDGGPGQIALHGLANIGGVLGTAASHGCVRLDGGAMRWLVVRVGSGVPVTIVN